MSCLTEVCNCSTADRSCSISARISGEGHGEVLLAATVGAATSTTLSASSASSSNIAVVLVEASTMCTFDGSLYRNNSRRKVLSVVLALSPSSCCILHNNCVGFQSPSSSALNSCWRWRCSDAAVRRMSCSFRIL